MSSGSVLTVSQLNNYIKLLLDGDKNLCPVYITGEISNFKHHMSGHFYLSLKDEESSLKAVMWGSQAAKLKFMPENGMKIIARGRVTAYVRDGQYQLYIDDMQPDGLGALNLAYEQLKEKLLKAGLFDEYKKKPLPYFPARVGVITAETGAAVRDIFSVLKRRYPLADIVFKNVLVQGEAAPAQLIAALDEFNEKQAADVIIIGRGGGSLEDLWAFNNEGLAYAAHRSEIPIISAIGHETDYTILDFAADLRAPTPSSAAELAVPDLREISGFVTEFPRIAAKLLKNKAETLEKKLEHVAESRVLSLPLNFIYDKQIEADRLYERAEHAFSSIVALRREHFGVLGAKLSALNPVNILMRGYSAVYKGGNAVRSVKSLSKGDLVRITLPDGTADAEIK